MICEGWGRNLFKELYAGIRGAVSYHVYFVVAGREDLDEGDIISEEQNAVILELEEMKDTDITKYFSVHGFTRFIEKYLDLIKKITYGKPILVALMVDWIKFGNWHRVLRARQKAGASKEIDTSFISRMECMLVRGITTLRFF